MSENRYFGDDLYVKGVVYAFIAMLFLIGPLTYALVQAGPGGIVFAIIVDVIVFGLFGFLYTDAKNNMEKSRRTREALAKISTTVKAYDSQNAVIVESKPLNPDIRMPRTMPHFCPKLSRLSSVIVTCPRCKNAFLRFFGIGGFNIKYSEYQSFKSGQLSFVDVIRQVVKEQGCPSSLICPHCGNSLFRSRQPSGVCSLTEKRVTGEKLFCCTVNQCTGTQ